MSWLKRQLEYARREVAEGPAWLRYSMEETMSREDSCPTCGAWVYVHEPKHEGDTGYMRAIPAADELDRLRAENEQFKARRRVMGCGYCGATVYTYGHDDPAPKDHEEALAAFYAHDRACPRNPLAVENARLRETNTRLNRRCQVYEAGLAEKLDAVKQKGMTLGRMLARAAAETMEGRVETLDAENARLREAIERAADKTRKPYRDEGHRCDYRVHLEAVGDSLSAALRSD